MKIQDPNSMILQTDKSQAPNYMIAEQTLILHTKIAKSLFIGEWEHGRLGLLQFAILIKKIWNAAKKDDPYAEWYLLKTYDQIEGTKEKLEAYEKLFQQQFDGMRGFQVDLFKHPVPLKHALTFATPFAYMGAKLIEQVDYVNRQLYTLKRIGLTPKENIIPFNLIREVQNTFRLAFKWQSTGVTRKDIIENNETAENAKKLMGEIPHRILNKEVDFNFLPRRETQSEKQPKDQEKQKTEKIKAK